MREERSKNPLALMEQVLMILLFALAAAICLKSFVTARNMSVQSVLRDHASAICQTTADAVKCEKGNMQAVKELINIEETSEGYEAYYDGDWNLTQKEEGVYTLRVCLDTSDEFLGCAKVTMIDNQGGEIFAIATAWQEGVDYE